MDITAVTAYLAGHISPGRLQHSLAVSKAAEEMALHYGLPAAKARLAGLLHDVAREIPASELLSRAQAFGIVVNDIERAQPVLLHAPLAARLVQIELGIEDEEVLQAMALHTTGGAGMGDLAKIIYLADMIAEGRSYPGLEDIRRIAYEDLDRAMLLATEQSIRYILQGGGLLHPDTIAARNYILLQQRKD